MSEKTPFMYTDMSEGDSVKWNVGYTMDWINDTFRRIAVLGLLCGVLALTAFGAGTSTNEFVFSLQEASAFDVAREAPDFARGQRAETGNEPHGDVKS
ncbi:hypothetical protein ACFLSJ_06980, partial [Verrucomicrobiota bacterium]